jgi:tetratricopeptide (TPR) repeat protein
MSRRPANRTLRALFLVWLWSTCVAAPALAASDPTTEHDQCVREAETDPQGALARARLWSNQGGGFEADHCAAMALFGMRQYREAAASFERLAQGAPNAGPSERARIYDQAGQARLVADDAMQAKIDFDAALRFAPGDADLMIDRAEALAALRNYWDAIDDLNRASDLAPQKPDIYLYRAAAYRAVGSLQLAREDIDRNLKLAPNNPVGLLERANIRRLAGDVAGAKEDWQTVVRLAPQTPEAAAASANLDRLGPTRNATP